MNLRGKFLFKLGFEKKEVVGLDIGSSQVKLIQLRKDNGGYAVTAAGITEIAASEGSNKRRRINTLNLFLAFSVYAIPVTTHSHAIIYRPKKVLCYVEIIIWRLYRLICMILRCRVP